MQRLNAPPNQYSQLDRNSNKNSIGGHLQASRSGVQYEDVEADMYNYDFKDKWHASQLNTADNWDVENYRKETLAKDGRDSNQKQRNEGVKLNNYFSYGDKVDRSLTHDKYKYSNNKVEKRLTI